MNLEQKAQLLRNNRALLKIERSFMRDVNAQLKWYYKKAAKFHLENRLFIARLTTEHYKNLLDIFVKQYGKILKVAVNSTANDFKEVPYIMEVKDVAFYEKLLQLYKNKYLLRRVESISENSKKRVQSKLIVEGNNKPNPELQAQEIAKLGKVSVARAALIARTETFSAMNFAQLESAKEFSDRYEVKKLKKWAAITDNRVRETHLEANSYDAIPLDAQFNIGGFDCDAPHDPNLPAEEVINCRCNLLFVNVD